VNVLEVLHVVGALLVWVAGTMVFPLGFAVGEDLVTPWLVAAGITAVLGGALWLATPRKISINPREGIAIVGLGWLAVVLAGSLPFLLTGVAPDPAAAVFESVSGFTTTGATVFPVIEDLPRSILLWRSITHWLGGMGIIVLGVAILPLLGVGGAQLFRAEAPGVSSERLQPRIASTARLLWGVYALLTLALAGLYVLLGMSVFEAINHAMSALATGGFSTKTASLGAFSGAIQWVTIVFMILAGTNFTLHYRLLTGQRKAVTGDAEWRWYVMMFGIAAVSVFLGLGLTNGEWSVVVLREAVFNVAAVHSTTGFATADFAAWPAFCQVALLGLMFVGAMGGSTGGGFKVVRAAVVLKHAMSEIQKVLHPRGVFATRLGHRTIRADVLLNVLGFLALYMVTHAIGTIVLAALGNDLVTATSAALAAMSSIGPGLGAVGPAAHYGHVGAADQVVLSALMLLGRLEFYTLLVLFVPGAWERWGGHR
jgi:trk system potassium uptake protein TrkH